MKISKEHVFRKWYGQFFAPTNHDYRRVQPGPSVGTVETTRVSHRPISPWELTVKDVCTTCNNGWMADRVEVPIENEMRKLMFGEPAWITAGKAVGIATWAAKTSIVRAAVDGPDRVVRPWQAKHVRDKLTPPPGTQVWIGQMEHTNELGSALFPADVSDDNSVPCGRIQLTSFMMGDLFLHATMAQTAAGARMQAMRKWPRWIDRQLLQIWPEPQAFAWPRSSIMTFDLAMNVANWRMGRTRLTDPELGRLGLPRRPPGT